VAVLGRAGPGRTAWRRVQGKGQDRVCRQACGSGLAPGSLRARSGHAPAPPTGGSPAGTGRGRIATTDCRSTRWPRTVIPPPPRSAMSPAVTRATPSCRMASAAQYCLLLGLLLLVQDAAAGAGPADSSGGLYFPLRSVELKLWVDGKSGHLLPPPGGVLLVPRLQGDSGAPPPTTVTYRLTDPASPGQAPSLPWLAVDAKTGVLTVKEQRVLSDAGARRQHVVWLDARGSAADRARPHRSARPFMVPAERARLNITITFELVQEDRPCLNKQGTEVVREDPCHYCHDSCFWERAELQVWENKQSTMLAPIGHSYADLDCGGQHQYKLLNGTEHFEVRGVELWTRAPLDRDAVPVGGAAGGPGPSTALAVECLTPWGAVERRNVHVVILDEDDNAPTLEKPEQLLEFNFSTEASLARGAHILVKDMDSRAANRFSDLAVDDPSGVVTSKKLEFDVTHGGVPHTVVSVRLQVKDPMAAKYNVTVTLTDLTLLDEAKRELKLVATMWGPPVTPPVAMSSSDKADEPSPAAPRSRRRAREVGAPGADGSRTPLVTLWTRAAAFARLAQVGDEADGRAYRLGAGAPAWANVTRRAGIVYVQDRSLLQREAPGRALLLQVLDDLGKAVGVPVTLVDAGGGGGGGRRNCSASGETTCGHGLRDECSWRELVPDSFKAYATCSPHLDTCPDGTCDPLEALHDHVCPQDCTGSC
ncbi:Proto-oncogene tyrosine-protein kinase receptor Ret, partial [Frankliniella fusca]